MWNEFKQFAVKGNVFDLAIGVIIGGAFGKIVTSLVNDLLMPIFGLILGGLNFSGLEIKIGDAVIRYGAFLQSVVDFLIVGWSIFLFIRLLNGLNKKKETEPAPAPAAAEPSNEEKLLAEIRDLLKQK
ncbi:MAG TPA: large conductance mechanosensitive channel protein MscL [Bacillota bacterium]|nr:large conductance mechanosensitive channel protein MscL [Bacillota bacterium]HPT87920.1 large conductance mechanosensitive channel protein MscL [Bacillota bacterium]